MRVAIVENTRITHHGLVGVALHERAALIDLLKPWTGQPLPDAPDADALIVFGGEQAATDDLTHPYLPGLARLMQAYTAADKPVLGICLGSADPVLSALPQTFPVFQWHSDTFTLPAGATHLATSATAHHQAFRIGRATYGTQFHFEASRPVVADWLRRFPDVIDRMAPGWADQHPRLAETQGTAAEAHGLTLARAWINLIRP